MASEVTVHSRDGNWKIEVEAWKNNFLFYSSIGTEVTVYHRERTTNVWGSTVTDWVKKNAVSISITNVYSGPVASGSGGSITRSGTWNNRSYAELKEWAVGAKISIPDGGVSGNAILDIDKVDGSVSVNIGQEILNATVSASSIISDSSIW
ncbi:MAG TPA: hypothetical protein VFN30_10530 [Chitinophagaceae bacterium]|nr:hypothetical protein [Chitinophagaceae bacterium]